VTLVTAAIQSPSSFKVQGQVSVFFLHRMTAAMLKRWLEKYLMSAAGKRMKQQTN